MVPDKQIHPESWLFGDFRAYQVDSTDECFIGKGVELSLNSISGCTSQQRPWTKLGSHITAERDARSLDPSNQCAVLCSFNLSWRGRRSTWVQTTAPCTYNTLSGHPMTLWVPLTSLWTHPLRSPTTLQLWCRMLRQRGTGVGATFWGWNCLLPTENRTLETLFYIL